MQLGYQAQGLEGCVWSDVWDGVGYRCRRESLEKCARRPSLCGSREPERCA